MAGSSANANKLAAGDLTGENAKDSNIEDIHVMMEAVRAIRKNLRKVITDTSDQLSQVNVDMGSMGMSVENGLQVSDTVTGAVTGITEGASETAGSINNMNNSMQDIGIRIEQISSAADETKLLSLNASIEAARAGEAGRGFAVVADSIQGLASQSTDSVNQIRKIIDEITAASDRNVSLANEIREVIHKEGGILESVGEGFDHVTVQVGGTVQDIVTIKERAEELSQVKDAILNEVNSLSVLSNETAASCEQTSSSMQELSAMMEGINEHTAKTRDVCDKVISTMGYFKVR